MPKGNVPIFLPVELALEATQNLYESLRKERQGPNSEILNDNI